MCDEVIKAGITEPAVLLNISQRFTPGLSEEELYEATRKEWVLSRASHSPRFAFSIVDSVIRQVYRINCWRQSPDDFRRFEFEGIVADDKAGYIGQSVKHLKPGAQNSVKYVNC